MVDQPTRTLRDLVEHVGRYPEDAFLFVREGLSYTAEKLHGPESDVHKQLQHFLMANDLEWPEVVAKYDAGTLPKELAEAIDSAGGCEKINRHVSGRELCWGLRDFALERWGLLARVVLESWRVKDTYDFGKIVFGFIDFDLMRKQPDDDVEDFHEVFSFQEAFDEPFYIGSENDDPDTSDDDDTEF
jgi:uncharacterized repeat protein (TIGR04138 family)